MRRDAKTQKQNTLNCISCKLLVELASRDSNTASSRADEDGGVVDEVVEDFNVHYVTDDAKGIADNQPLMLMLYWIKISH